MRGEGWKAGSVKGDKREGGGWERKMISPPDFRLFCPAFGLEGSECVRVQSCDEGKSEGGKMCSCDVGKSESVRVCSHDEGKSAAASWPAQGREESDSAGGGCVRGRERREEAVCVSAS